MASLGHPGSSGFTNAHLASMPMGTFAPIEFPAGSTLTLEVYIRALAV
jgi:hypothetical protein